MTVEHDHEPSGECVAPPFPSCPASGHLVGGYHDEGDRAEMLAVAELMESLRAPG